MNVISELPFDNQAEIIAQLDFKEVMKLVKPFPGMKLDDSLWTKILFLTKVEVDNEKLDFMSPFDIYMEHLIKSNYTQTVKLIVQEEKDEDDDNIIDLIFRFEINTVHHNTSVNTSVCFTYLEPRMYDSKRWTQFMISAFERKDDELRFCSSNGNVGISVHLDDIIFDVGKFGAGGDGSGTFRIPFENCKSVFFQAISELKKLEK